MSDLIELTELEIDVARAMASVSHPECGAEVLFVGTTRQWTQRVNEKTGQSEKIETEFLIYEAFHEMALSQMKTLAAEARQRWPVKALALIHRVGKVLPQEASVAVAVSCPHRSEAFEAGRWLIDSIKHQATIWKQEHYVQVGPEWIHPTSGNCSCPDPASRPIKSTEPGKSIDPIQPPAQQAQQQ